MNIPLNRAAVNSNRAEPRARRLLLAGALWLAGAAAPLFGQTFTSGDLLLSYSVYTGTASTITVGQALPGGGNATVNGSYPNVFENEAPDASFGITEPIYVDELATSGGAPVLTMNVTALAASDGINLTTSFSSKSELALNLSQDGTAVTFMGYEAAANALDQSNANSPGLVDPTNPDAQIAQHAVGQLNANGTISVTPVDAYSGDNARSAILAGGYYYMAGSAGNGSGIEPSNIVKSSGIQMIAAGSTTGNSTVVGVQQGTAGNANGYQFGYSVVENGDAADKSGKDDNLRGLTLYNGTLYVAKGSGSKGIDTVYQVGNTPGTLPTPGTAANTTISVLPGFPTTLASNTTVPSAHPFGLWFANADTLYVGDEGNGILGEAGNTTVDPYAGLEKWSYNGTLWHLDYTLTAGLNLGTNYTVANGPLGQVYPTSLDPATDGLRDITGEINGNGTVTIYAVTSTVSTATDEGADPNQLVSITDNLADANITQASGEDFATLDTATYGEVLRGVSFTPVPEPGTYALALGTAGGLAAWWRRRKLARVRTVPSGR